MFYKLIALCGALALLYGCTKHAQSNAHHYSSRCLVIKEEINKVHNGQIGSQPSAIQTAKLLREYKGYGCGD